MISPLSPYIRIAWYSTLEPHTLIGPRDIYDYEILYLKEGTASIIIEGIEYFAQSGDVFLFRPHQRHSIQCLNDFPVIQPHVHFDLLYRENRQEIPVSYITYEEMNEQQKNNFAKDSISEFFPNIPSKIHLQKPKIFEEYLFDLIDEYNNPSIFTELRQQWLFLRLFNLFITEVGYVLGYQTHRTSENTATRVKLYLEDNVGRHISLNEMTKALHIDKSYMIHIFKQVYGDTPLEYHKKIRIKRARNMLVNTNLTISEIAEATGFNSLHDFDRVFRKIDGSTPSSYRGKK